MDNQALLESIRSIIKEETDPINSRLSKLEQGQAKLEQGQAKLEQGVERLEDALASTMNDVAELKKDMSVLRGAVVVIEQEHGKALQFLLDRDDEHHADIERLKAAL